MYLSLKWLKDFVDISKSVSPADLGLKLTMHTVEIDSVRDEAEKYKNVVVGKILEIKKHPNADRLSLVKVDVGAAKLDIVCGASNIGKDQAVPVALIGAVLPNGLEIKEADVRGEKSHGMLCAEDELGLGEDHAGIMILKAGAKPGKKFADYLKLDDVIYEVDNKSITHRPDLWCHYGIAREISAFLGVKLKDYKVNENKIKTEKGAKLKVKIENPKECARYTGAVVRGVKIGLSPEWMRERLIAAGLKPINNIVDATNYIMMELGQPMHAFDLDKLSLGKNNEIIVRQARAGERLKCLDGEERILDETMTVIADKDKALAIAGVMGGEESEITAETSSILLESANFNFISVRKTSHKLGLRTESSNRFEKSLDPGQCETALKKAIELIAFINDSAVLSGGIADAGRFRSKKMEVKLDLDRAEKIIGEKIEEKEIINILTKLGFESRKSGNLLEITVPAWRASKEDLIAEDIIEEIVRIYGFNKLPLVSPSARMTSPPANFEKRFERKIKTALAGTGGMCEVFNYSFVGEEQLSKLDINYSSHIRILNPLSALHTMLRQSLAPNLINNIKTNQARFEKIKIFEIGRVYFSAPGEEVKDARGAEKLPYEEKRLGLAVAGADRSGVFGEIKGIIEALVEELDMPAEFERTGEAAAWADKNAVAIIKIAGKDVGTVSLLSADCARRVGVKKTLALAEINLRELFAPFAAQDAKKYESREKFPPLVRDLAFVVDSRVIYSDIKKTILDFDELIKEAELFDVYEGAKLGKGKKSLAFHVVYQAERTLTSEEADALQKKLFSEMEKKFGAKVRDF